MEGWSENTHQYSFVFVVHNIENNSFVEMLVE